MSGDVSYRLRFDGRPASGAVSGAVRRLEVEEHTEMASMIRIELAVGLVGKDAVFELFEGGSLDRLKPVRVDIQVGTEPYETVLEAYVVETRMRVESDAGQSTLVVAALDASVTMGLEERVKAWPDLADSDVATQVFQAHGLTPQVTATKPTRQALERTVIQHGTDWQFLQHIARRNGYDCFVTTDPRSGKGIGHFHAPDTSQKPQGVLTTNLGDRSNLLHVEVAQDHLRPAQAEARSVLVKDLTPQAGLASAASLAPMGATAVRLGDKPRKLLLPRAGVVESAELKTYAQGVTDRSTWSITAEGEVDPALYGDVLRARKPVLLRGLGRPFSGAYMVERVRHTFDATGYRQDFTLRRNALGPKGSDDFSAEVGR